MTFCRSILNSQKSDRVIDYISKLQKVVILIIHKHNSIYIFRLARLKTCVFNADVRV